VTDQCKKPKQRRPCVPPGHDHPESPVTITGIRSHTIPEFTYRHQWQAGDLLMWDNCSTQHKAMFDYDLQLRRLMHRTTIRGSVPF
jgi:taurine dioxygenase